MASTPPARPEGDKSLYHGGPSDRERALADALLAVAIWPHIPCWCGDWGEDHDSNCIAARAALAMPEGR